MVKDNLWFLKTIDRRISLHWTIPSAGCSHFFIEEKNIPDQSKALSMKKLWVSCGRFQAGS
jgi:hypothetical protein